MNSPAVAVRPAPAGATRSRVDIGRLVLVPVFALLLTANLLAVPHAVRSRHGVAMLVALAVSALTVAFYLLVLWAYLRRGPATSTARSSVTRAVAVIATGLPVVLPVLVGLGTSLVLNCLAGVLMLVGLALSVLSLRALNRNLSVIPQVRDLAVAGPYRWVRHPLYVGELVTVLGITMRAPRPAPMVLWLVLVGLQAYRASAEERLLAATLPAYAGYRASTARFVPRLY